MDQQAGLPPYSVETREQLDLKNVMKKREKECSVFRAGLEPATSTMLGWRLDQLDQQNTFCRHYVSPLE